MSKQEFMKELEALLAELPKEEREEAVRYYDAYFEDAGAENEQVVIGELGSAERVAAQLLRDFKAEKEAGVYTEKGYQDGEEKKETPVKYVAESNASKSEGSLENARREATTDGSGIHIRKKGMNAGTLTVCLIAAVFTFPVWFPLLMALLGVMFGVFLALAMLVFGVGVGGLACAFAGVVILIAGFVKLAAIPIVGLVFLAAALLVFGIGCLLLLLAGAILKLLIWIAGGCLRLCGRIFHGRREATV